MQLVRKFDGQFPEKYFGDFLTYLDITEEEFYKTIDKYRKPHIWKKESNEWKLQKAVWHEVLSNAEVI